MSNPEIAVMMMVVFILFVLLGFPIAFTLLAMGIGFGYYAYYNNDMTSIFDNRIFDLVVQNTYSVMDNHVLTAVPLFLFSTSDVICLSKNSNNNPVLRILLCLTLRIVESPF